MATATPKRETVHLTAAQREAMVRAIDEAMDRQIQRLIARLEERFPLPQR
jgi:DNA-binding MarR family transcriptional regulator